MNCRYSDEDIALYVERDLSQSTLCEMEAHLLECEACGSLAGRLRESQAIFKSLRQEMVSVAALGEVRTRVLAKVEAVASTTPWGRRVERWLWAGFRRGYALAGVGFAILVLAGWWRAQTLQPLGMPDPLRPPAAAAVPLTRGTGEVSATASVALPERHRGRRRRPQGVAHSEVAKTAAPAPVPAATATAAATVRDEQPRQLVVKLLTDDPNIVIYWLVDQNGG